MELPARAARCLPALLAALASQASAAAVDRRVITGGPYPTQVRVLVDRGAAALGATMPLGVGVPLKPGQVTDPGRLALANEAGRVIPAAFEARTRWPDGSVQWLWADFVAPVAASYAVVSDRSPAPLPTPGVRVNESAQAIAVDAGAIRVQFDRAWGAPRRVELATSSGGWQTAGEGDGAGVYLVDANRTVAALGGAQGALDWRVETSSAVRAVVRVEGYYTDSAGNRVARGVVRYHLYWDQPLVKIDHTFIVTRDNRQTTYREIGVRLPVAATGSVAARFGVQGGPPATVSLTATGSEAHIFQRTAPHLGLATSEYQLGNQSRTLSTGREAAGWVDVAGGGGAGLLLAVRDFAPQFPAELHATRGMVSARLWSSRGGGVLDYRPTTLISQHWGDAWVNNVSASPSNAGTVADLRGYDPSPVGVARTHELMAVYHLPGTDDQYALADAFQMPPVVYPDPHWTVHVHPAVVWPMAAKGEGGGDWASVERLISTWWSEHLVPLGLFPYAGWLDWGKLPDIRYEKGPDGVVYAQWTRLNNTNAYFIVKHLLLGFARSGERTYLEAASRYNRLLADTYVVHAAGGRDDKQLGRLVNDARQHVPVYWGGRGIYFGLSSREPLFGFALDYLLTDSRRMKDTVELVGSRLVDSLAAARAQLGAAPTRAQQQRVVNDHFRCDPFLGLSMLLSAYRVVQDPALAAQARFVLDTVVDARDPGGIDTEYFRTARCDEGPLYKPDRTLVALIEHFDLLGDEDARLAAIQLAHVAAADRDQPIGYQNLTGAWAARVHAWTGSAAMLEAMRYQAFGARAIFEAYENLGEPRTGVAHFLSTVGPVGHGGLQHSRYEFRNVPGLGSSPAVLDFSSPQNGVVFLALPAAIWSLSAMP